jgi:transitional endoplasmic reticulum ATPase
MLANKKSILERGNNINNRYTVLFFITGGNTSQSYRVKDNESKLWFLKIFSSAKLKPSQYNSNAEVLEISIISHVNHPNIVKAKDSGEFILNNEKYSYLVTDFISGESLNDKLLREHSINVYDVKEIIQPVLNGLNYLHNLDQPVIHNDITSSNIMIDLAGNVTIPKIIDFSHARYFYHSSKTFQKEGLNPYFMANESFNGIFSPQSDLFSVGALMYYLLFGLPPWYVEKSKYNSDKININEAILEQRDKPLKFLNKNGIDKIDEITLDIIRKATHSNTDIRFKTAKEFILALTGEIVVDIRGSEKKQLKENPNTIKKDFKPNRLGKGFDRIAGMEELKAILYNDVIRALNEKELYESYGLTIPNGMLLYGPPGCGKTFIAESFAEEVKYNYVQIKPSDLASIYVHGSQEKIGKLFDEARKNAPTILFIDELDAIMPSREGDLNHSYSSEVNEFLAQMTNCSQDGIFIIGATNRPDKIDRAIMRTGRLDKHIYLPPPDSTARELMFRLHLKKRPLELGIDYELLAKNTINFVSSDIEFICNETARKALQSNLRISSDLVMKIIKITKPSISINEINKYENIRKIIEQEVDENTSERTYIGFKLPKSDKND